MSLTVTNIDKRFQDVQALKGVSLAVERGSLHALVGENGAGKSTLLKIMAGIYRPDAGEARLDDSIIEDNPASKVKIGFVPTQRSLFPGYNEKKLIRLYAEIYGERFNAAQYRAIVEGVPLGKQTARHWSTGMQLIAGVAFAIAVKPNILLLDEPFAGLDVILRHRLITLLIEEVESCGIGVLISSHNVNELEKLCDRATFISRGKVIKSGAMDEVKRQSVRRYQVVFEGEAPPDIDKWPELITMETIGRVHYLTISGGFTGFEEKLRANGVLMIEELGVSLEDAFRLSYEQGENK
jgi:ABC-2 type transport system ATP-binding protein